MPMVTGLDLLSTAHLKGKTAIITGSTSGIGLALAEAFAAAGCNIALSGFGEPAFVADLIKRLSLSNKCKVTHTNADLRDPAAVRGYIETAIAELGTADILVNNAGMQHVAAVDTFPDDKWDMIVDINLNTAFHAMKAVMPSMKARNWGRIINIASTHGLVASPFKSAYVASKHGLVGLTKALALEVAKTGITVNAICPGYVNTPLVQNQVKDQARVHNMADAQVISDIILAAQPSKRFIEPAEVAGVALFLCTDAAASITGAALSQDGGWTSR
jgi:3-hydroxybutyrate dehydrogenase